MKIIAIERCRLAVRKFGDETAIVDLRGRTVHRLNATASRLWEIIVGGGSYEDLAASLCETYEVTSDDARRDVDALIESLVDAGLVRIDGAAGSANSEVRGSEGATAA